MKYEAKIGHVALTVWPVTPKSGAKVALVVDDDPMTGPGCVDLDPDEADALAAALVATASEVRRMREGK